MDEAQREFRAKMPLIERTAPRKPDRLQVRRTETARVEITLTAGDLFRLLGIVLPPDGTDVHILLARSHGNEGSHYRMPEGGNVVEIRMKWEVPLDD